MVATLTGKIKILCNNNNNNKYNNNNNKYKHHLEAGIKFDV